VTTATVTVTVTVEKRKKKKMSTERAPDTMVEADGRAESTTVLVDEGSVLSGYRDPTPADSDSDSRADSVSRMTRVSPGMGPHWTLSIRRVRVRRRPFALFISVQALNLKFSESKSGNSESPVNLT
jgi:hypothetical protein